MLGTARDEIAPFLGRAEEQRLLSYLSVFVGGLTLEAVEAVCGGEDALDGLSSLAAKSLVEVHEEAGGSRRFRWSAWRWPCRDRRAS